MQDPTFETRKNAPPDKTREIMRTHVKQEQRNIKNLTETFRRAYQRKRFFEEETQVGGKKLLDHKDGHNLKNIDAYNIAGEENKEEYENDKIDFKDFVVKH